MSYESDLAAMTEVAENAASAMRLAAGACSTRSWVAAIQMAVFIREQRVNELAVAPELREAARAQAFLHQEVSKILLDDITRQREKAAA